MNWGHWADLWGRTSPTSSSPPLWYPHFLFLIAVNSWPGAGGPPSTPLPPLWGGQGRAQVPVAGHKCAGIPGPLLLLPHPGTRANRLPAVLSFLLRKAHLYSSEENPPQGGSRNQPALERHLPTYCQGQRQVSPSLLTSKGHPWSSPPPHRQKKASPSSHLLQVPPLCLFHGSSFLVSPFDS